MRSKILVATFAVACSIVSSMSWAADAVEAPPAATTTEAKPAQPKADDERMVCTLEKTLGSNRKQRVCRSLEQVRRDREAAREQMGRPGVCSTCGGGG